MSPLHFQSNNINRWLTVAFSVMGAMKVLGEAPSPNRRDLRGNDAVNNAVNNAIESSSRDSTKDSVVVPSKKRRITKRPPCLELGGTHPPELQCKQCNPKVCHLVHQASRAVHVIVKAAHKIQNPTSQAFQSMEHPPLVAQQMIYAKFLVNEIQDDGYYFDYARYDLDYDTDEQ